MKVTIKQLTSWNDVLNAARLTAHKGELDKEPSDLFKAAILLASFLPPSSLTLLSTLIHHLSSTNPYAFAPSASLPRSSRTWLLPSSHTSSLLPPSSSQLARALGLPSPSPLTLHPFP